MLAWLQQYTQKETHRVVGLMSGTSVDGIDAALVEIAGSGPQLHVHLEGFLTVPFGPEVRQRILHLCAGGDVAEVATLNMVLGELFAEAVQALLSLCEVSPGEVDLIGSHGQTICHLPAHGATLQIGEPCVIAERTGITTVADFRPRDMAAGGQGAPLVPYVDYCLLRHATRHRIVQNIGGIANCTVLPAGCTLRDIRAWDTGPGNMVIDECVRLMTDGSRHFDKDGDIAAQGRVDERWLESLMQHVFFHRQPPKSAGREEFGRAFSEQFVREGEARGLATSDVVATATALTAASIAHSNRSFLPPEWHHTNSPFPVDVVLGGGGTSNPVLRQMLAARVTPFEVLTHEDCGLNSDAKEALAFAVLAHETVLGVANNVPGATGAAKPVVSGKIVPGSYA